MEDLWDDINLSSLPFKHGPRLPVAFQDFFAAARETPPPPAPAVARKPTAPEFQYFFGGVPHHSASSAANNPLLQPSYSASSGSSFDGFPPSPACPDGRRRKRVHDSGDQRHIRMMKNREAAARSRARKEAHTISLESEVALLLKENAKLNKQYQRLRQEVEAHKGCNKLILQRTSSAPF